MNINQDWGLENSYINLPKQLFTEIPPTPVIKPQLLLFNKNLAESLELPLSFDDEETLAQLFAGNILPKNVTPIAQSYAGHQFGHFSILGDGRAHLIGEKVIHSGNRFDIQLKGSGPTPYSRGGDGRAGLGPMLREYLISEAMHALKIPTTRSLAVVKTGESIMRSTLSDGAILTRIASSHIRVGTFEYARRMLEKAELKQLADYAIDRHYPQLNDSDNKYQNFLEAVIKKQAQLMASWMHIGFIHGVMNTDNMTISGETIDYGPCAFMDIFSMEQVFSSIDRHGRYKYGNQASIAHWNLVRLADSLLLLLDNDRESGINIAEQSLATYSEIFNHAWIVGMRDKLGLCGEEEEDFSLAQKLLDWMQASKVDYTKTFHDLGQEALPEEKNYASKSFLAWHRLWSARLSRNKRSLESSRKLMQSKNPAVVPYNNHVEQSLKAAEHGDLKPFMKLMNALKKPFEDSLNNKNYRDTVVPDADYQTFCGT